MNDDLFSVPPRDPGNPELATIPESREEEIPDITSAPKPGTQTPGNIHDALTEIREELAGASAENRRNTRRIFDALKQFGTVLDALSATVNSLHESARPAAPSAPPEPRSPLGVIELADRIDRIAQAMKRTSTPPRPWWPAARRAQDAWFANHHRIAQSLAMLATHSRSLLASSGLEHIPCEGEIFDPSCMTAVESVSAPHLADHTVVAEILPGWRESGGGRIIRPAQVRVARNASTHSSEKSQ